MAESNEVPNFEAAEVYLAQAKASHEAGDEHKRRAACVMVIVALGFSVSPPRIHLGHLKK